MAVILIGNFFHVPITGQAKSCGRAWAHSPDDVGYSDCRPTHLGSTTTKSTESSTHLGISPVPI